MSTDPKDAPTGTPPAEEPKITAGALREMIRDEVAGLVAKLTPGTTPPTGEPGKTEAPTDIAGQVAAALSQLRNKEKREARDKEVDTLLEKSRQEAKPTETAPLERSRMHKFMGWGE